MKKRTLAGLTIATAGAMIYGSGLYMEQRQTRQLRGYDVLGVAKYCDVFLKAPKLPAFSTLVQTFGNPYPCIKKRLDMGGVEVVQLDLIDATCHRNRVCAKNIPKPTNLKALKKRAAKARKNIVQRYPGVEVHLSPGLEHDVRDNRTVRKMCKAVNEGCPECLCVNSPFTGARPKNIPVESHNPKEDTFSLSTDGISIFDIDTVKYNKKGKRTNYMWFPELNLRYTGEKEFIMPKERKCKPNIALFRQAFITTQDEPAKPAAPPVCKSVRDLKDKELWKTNAESYCNDDVRGNKPLFVSRFQDKTLDIINPHGKKVAFMRYYGTFEHGYHRHYLGTGSGENPYQLYNKAGGEHAFIKRGNECIRINTVRRLGYYRNK